MTLDRRELFKISAGAAGSLLVGFTIDDLAEAKDEGKVWMPNAWLRVDRDGRLVFILDKAEMGQGVHTSLTTIFAEEFDVDPELLEVETAPVDPRYGNPSTAGLQITGGSSSVSTTYVPLRRAGATARALMIHAAAKSWKVAAKDCTTAGGKVLHAASNRQLSYGELAAAAAKLAAPKDVALRDPSTFRWIGKERRRLDGDAKVRGQAVFGLDVVPPDVHHAAVLFAPSPGATIKKLDAAEAKEVPGVVKVVPYGRGVAVVAKKFWQARLAVTKLKVTWDEPGEGPKGTDAIFAAYAESSATALAKLKKDKDAHSLLLSPKHGVEAEYRVPFQAHMAMEPINCTARVSKTSCEIWAPTQAAGLARQVVEDATGLSRDQIQIHTTFLGGGFGRRLYQDFVQDAVEIAQASGLTVKMIWSREDDLKHDFYRPASVHCLAAALDDDGTPLAWAHAISGQSILSKTLPIWMNAMLPVWVPDAMKNMAGSVSSGLVGRQDPTAVEGADELPYEVGQKLMDYQLVETNVPVGFWRSVGHSYTGFVVESFVDELAHAAKMDPLAFRRKFLASGKSRLRNVLDFAAKKAGWGEPLPKGVGRGLAVHESFGSICAQVADVAVKDNVIKVLRVVAAVDCGQVINPGHVKAQVTGAIVFGLSAALYDSVTFKDGKVEQSNFHDYRVMRFDEMPEVKVYLVDTDHAPKGVGEPGVPPVAAAVGNAVFALTGKRLRSLPFRFAPGPA